MLARINKVRAERHQHPPSAAKCTSREPFHRNKSYVAVASHGVMTRGSWRSMGISALVVLEARTVKLYDIHQPLNACHSTDLVVLEWG